MFGKIWLASLGLVAGLTGFASAAAPAATAQAPGAEEPAGLEFKRARLDIGAASQRIRAITTDDYGFVWLATPSGLVRWDGSRADVYHAQASSTPLLPRSGVTDVADAPGPGVWVAAETLVHLDPADLGVVDTGIPAAQIVAGPDVVWALGPGGLVRYEPTSGRSDFVTAADLWRSDGYDNLLELGEDGTVYVATEWGLHAFAEDGQEREIVLPGGARGLAGGSTIWATSPNGLWSLADREDGQAHHVATIAELVGIPNGTRPVPEASAGLVEHDGFLWFGLTDGGLVRYTIESGESVVVQPEDAGWTGAEGHRAIEPGPSGGLLVVASEVGLFRSVQAGQQVALLASDQGTRVADLVGVDNRLWMATEDRGLVVLDITDSGWAELDDRGHEWELPTIAIIERESGFWLATPHSGLFSFSDETGDFATIMGTERAQTIAAAEWGDEGVVAIMRGTEVRAYDARGRLVHNLDMAQFHRGTGWGPRFITSRDDGLVWVGGEHGLDLIDLAAGTTRRWSFDQGLVGAEVFDLFEDVGGYVWLATSAGIERLHLGSDSLTHFGTQTGLPPGEVSLLVPHPRRDAMWAATPEGLALFDLRSEHVELLIDVGLSPEARFIAVDFDEDGTSFVATTEGVVRIAGDFPGTHTLDGSAHIVSLAVDGVRQPLGDPAKIDSRSDIEFGFAFGEYDRPGALTYQYRLDGYDDAWHGLLPGARTVTYADLDAGTYEFRVRARTAAGTSAVDSIRFRVERSFPLWAPLAAAALIALVGGAFAVTLRKKHQAAARAAELEVLVAERTHELAETAAAAAQANDSKSQFLAMISHELRTPLNAVMGFTDLIAQSSSSGQVSTWADRAQQASEQLDSMVEDLLFVARQGDLPENVPPVARDLQQVVDSAVALVRSGAEAPAIETEVRTTGPYLVSESRVMQVLINLTNNALRHGGGSPAWIQVQRIDDDLDREHPAPKTHLIRFSVTDWGPGMAAEEVERLLEPFSRGSEAGTGLGLGLGLTICTQILARLGSSLGIATRPGGPTKVWFDLSLQPIPDPALAEPEPTSAGDVEDPILVVDDDPHCRQLLVDALEASGFRPFAASSGPEALALLTSLAPRIVVTDHLMPGMIGASLARRVRGIEGFEHVWVVCVTAMPDEASGYKEYDHILAKPYRPRDLVGAVSDFLAKVP